MSAAPASPRGTTNHLADLVDGNVDGHVGDVADDRSSVLHEQLGRADAHVAALQAEYDELLADPEVIQEDRDAAALILEHARRQRDAVRGAVARVEKGNYGRCVRCGGDIGAERLEALVDVTTCVGCAAKG